jgi:hypothetical protein
VPVSIQDRQLDWLYRRLEARNAHFPFLKIGKRDGLKLLSEIGDVWEGQGNVTLDQLKAPNQTVKELADIVKKGMTDAERADLVSISLGSLQMTRFMKELVNEVLTQTPLPPPATGAFQITGDQTNGLSGIAKPGARIEAINLSTAPKGRLHLDDTAVIGTADANGKFENAKLEMREGDVIRLRSRNPDGTVSDWVTLKAKGLESRDTRNAQLADLRINLSPSTNGKISVTNINESRQVSEPGAQIQFRNDRTRETTRVTLDDKGNFPAGLTVNGRGGDVFSVAISDGVNNTGFFIDEVKLAVPGSDSGPDLIKDPDLHKDERNADGTPRFGKRRFSGPVYKGPVSEAQVQQGQIGDCYFAAGSGAVARTRPDLIAKMIESVGDGTYIVHFKQRGYNGVVKDVPIKIDGDLYVRSNGTPLYGATLGFDKGQTSMAMWFPLIEKAYATWKGSYDAIGNGGYSSQVMEAITGGAGRYVDVPSRDANTIFATIKRAVDNDWPATAGTYGDDHDALYTNTGIYSDHDYSVMGYEEAADGKKYVKLRNPWGESEPRGNGANDGYFKIEISEFMKLYGTVSYSEAPRA